MIRGRGGGLKREGGLLTFCPEKGRGNLRGGGLIEDIRCATQLSTHFSKYTIALEFAISNK